MITYKLRWFGLLLAILILSSCHSQVKVERDIELGCQQMDLYLPLIQDKNVGLLVNHTSLIGDTHLVDSLISRGTQIQSIFSPEHGFRGAADAGEHVKTGIDAKTGISIISLYGKNKKPLPEQVQDLDVIIFDIQDVGVRFYTYISSMHYMMEACAENGIKFIVLDRPNPNGDYFDGPVLEEKFKSFVGMHPIPIVHGLTVGELARMINEEGWLSGNEKCDLTVIPVNNYSHQRPYSLPVKPSPNLPNDLSIRLYPSLCFFEATEVSVGRGTYMPFQIIGYPDSIFGSFAFIPKSIDGMSKNPMQMERECFGIDLRETESLDHQFTLKYFLDFYNKPGYNDSIITRERWFNLLAGTDRLLKQLKSGTSWSDIKASWETELKAYKMLRDNYLLYPLD
ncbi:MAG: DUF1343 domain-containing protein [Marinilabiliaceae bacterium]|nr:DUF1343 domain-containing protein [Marinilabiliaceae bacterium]